MSEIGKMPSSPLRSKSLYRAWSASLPSSLHPLTPQVDEHMSRLRSSESTSSSLSSIGKELSILDDLYDSFHDFLILPNTQKAFEKSEKCVEEVLDGYMRLLDLCAKAKDISLHTKQDVQDLLSMLRRRRDTNEIGKYLTSRKKANKGIQKSLKDLTNIKTKHYRYGTEATGLLFIEIEEASIKVFESLMSYIAGSKSQPRLCALVGKTIFRKSVSFKNEVLGRNEFKKVDDDLDFLINKKVEKYENVIRIENLQRQLMKMEFDIQDLEEGLECLFRRLIKTRVVLLNILNH